MERSALLKSREYWITKIQLDLFNLIENYRKENNLTKTQIAAKLGVSKGYITQVLNGDFDHKVSKLVDLALAFDHVPIVRFEDYNEYIADDYIGISSITLYKDGPSIRLFANNKDYQYSNIESNKYEIQEIGEVSACY